MARQRVFRSGLRAAVLGCAMLSPVAAWAQTAAEPAGLFSPDRTTLFGDAGGVRTSLGAYGLSVGLQESDEVFGNTSGGIHRGAAYDGMTLFGLGLDTAKTFGWQGGTFNVSALQLHGRSISADNLGALQAVSGNEADRATRLWELWYQQSLFGGRADIKIGQQAFDQEFMTSTYGGLFLNSVMGSPAVPAIDWYAGGPQYPLASPGIRVRVQATPSVTVLAGVFDDNPPGGPFNDDSALRGAEKSGTAFNMNTGALWLAEVQYALNPPPAEGADAASTGLPGTYKLGGWYDSASFPDQRVDGSGLSLADPASSGDPRMRRGNYGIYAVMDQAVWRPDPKSPRMVGLFAQVNAAPSDRNQVSFSATAGATLAAPLPGRDNDVAGIGFGVARISGTAGALDRDTRFYTGQAYPVRTTETFIEATYAAQIAGWWQVQPDVQYIIRPGGGIENPARPGSRIGDAFVLGLRSTITF